MYSRYADTVLLALMHKLYVLERASGHTATSADRATVLLGTFREPARREILSLAEAGRVTDRDARKVDILETLYGLELTPAEKRLLAATRVFAEQKIRQMGPELFLETYVAAPELEGSRELLRQREYA